MTGRVVVEKVLLFDLLDNLMGLLGLCLNFLSDILSVLELCLVSWDI